MGSPHSYKDGYIYFIQRSIDDSIKIGRSRYISMRFYTLKRQYNRKYGELSLLGCIFANNARLFEKEMHERFDLYRVDGEWFSPEHELLKFINTKTEL